MKKITVFKGKMLKISILGVIISGNLSELKIFLKILLTQDVQNTHC